MIYQRCVPLSVRAIILSYVSIRGHLLYFPVVRVHRSRYNALDRGGTALAARRGDKVRERALYAVLREHFLDRRPIFVALRSRRSRPPPQGAGIADRTGQLQYASLTSNYEFLPARSIIEKILKKKSN